MIIIKPVIPSRVRRAGAAGGESPLGCQSLCTPILIVHFACLSSVNSTSWLFPKKQTAIPRVEPKNFPEVGGLRALQEKFTEMAWGWAAESHYNERMS